MALKAISKRIGTPLVRYQAEKFSFEYPENASVVVFDDPDSPMWRLIIDSGENEYIYDIEKMPVTPSLEKQIQKIFEENYRKSYENENVHPYPLALPNVTGWRCIFRFVDGFSAPLVFDVTYVQSPSLEVYRIQYYEKPKVFEMGLIYYELLLRSFAFVEQHR